MRQVGDEGRQQPGQQEVEAFVGRVEQLAKLGQAVAFSNRGGERLHGSGAAEDDRRTGQGLPAVGADADASAVAGAQVNEDSTIGLPSDAQLWGSRVGVGGDAFENGHGVGEAGLGGHRSSVDVGVDAGELRAQAGLAAQRERKVGAVDLHAVRATVIGHEQVVAFASQSDEL